MYTKEQLEKMTCEGLREVAKEIELPGRSAMKKAELLQALIAEAEKEQAQSGETLPEATGADIKPILAKDSNARMEHVEQAPIGTLVAFQLPNGRVKSAKIARKSSKQKKLKLETTYGAQFIIPYDKVVWVKSGERWPRAVYQLLKANENGA